MPRWPIASDSRMGYPAICSYLAPDWITSTESRYNIVAKTAPGTAHDQIPKMMQALLAERFKLAFTANNGRLAIMRWWSRRVDPGLPEPTDGSGDHPCRSQRPAPYSEQPHADV